MARGFYKRGEIWHCDFTVNGQRFRQSLDTTDWREAQRKKRKLESEAEKGTLTPKTREFARLPFTDAAEKHLADRILRLAERSIQTERERLKPLRRYLGNTPVASISADMVREYVAVRSKARVANKTINLELGVLRGILKRAKLWHTIADDIKALPTRRQVGKALAPDEKVRLQTAATTRPEWMNARWAMVMSLNTTMRACEVRNLQWRDINFSARTLTVRNSKTDAGRRVIPLNKDAWEAILQLHERAQLFAGAEGEHYIFPACENGHIDPSKPQKSWRSAWRSLRKAAGLPGLRFHDLRHHAITELAESMTSDSTIMSIAGHVSREMLEHYSHVRLDAKRQALDALSNTPSKASCVTKHVTNVPSDHNSELVSIRKDWSGREDLNLRPPGPEPGALPG